MELRILDILKEKGKTKDWIDMQLGLSDPIFNRLVNGETKAIQFETLKALCEQNITESKHLSSPAS